MTEESSCQPKSSNDGICDLVNVDQVHIPIALPTNVYRLYRFGKLPVRLDDIVIMILPDHDFIAISPDNRHYVPLTTADLEGCDKFHAIHLCHQIRVAKSFDQPNCIAHLWNNNDKEALKSCCIVIKKPEQ